MGAARVARAAARSGVIAIQILIECESKDHFGRRASEKSVFSEGVVINRAAKGETRG